MPSGLPPHAGTNFSRRIGIVICSLVWFLLVAWAGTARAAYVQAHLSLEQLPHEHDYQKTLRDFMSTLTEQDFTVERQEIKVVPTADPDEQYRMWMFTLQPNNVTAAMLPAASFTLKSIESAKGLVLPSTPVESHLLSWLAGWDYPGNPYHGSKALKLRAFMLAATDMLMLDHLYEHDPQNSDRSDFLGGNLIWMGHTYQVVKDILPAAALAAYETGLKKHVMRLNTWGPKGLMTDMDLFAAVGLRYIFDATSDAEIKKVAEDYSRVLFTDPKYFHPAGYFVDNGCFDTSYNGISLYFATWAALMGDWPFIRTAVEKAHRLRAHLCFPDPDGGFSGPSEMTSRCSSDPPHDQWQFPPRMVACGMAADEAIHLYPMPAAETLANAPTNMVAQINNQLAKPRTPGGIPWGEFHWIGQSNYACDVYQKGFYAKRRKLAGENSPLLKPLYQRAENFVRNFENTFLIARYDSFAVAIHTGPVGGLDRNWHRPYGFGGGELCAFWTPSTGSVMLGRRRGIQGIVFDSFDEWRIWPIHAVSGLTADGHLITSAKIKNQEVRYDCDEKRGGVHVAGIIPKRLAEKHELVPTDIQYERRFSVDAEGIEIETGLRSDGKEKLVELYETIPIFLRETAGQKMPSIRFQVADQWAEATPESTAEVRAIEIERFNGSVRITFADPVSARLSPAVWTDGFQTSAQCRTVLVDLLATRDKTKPFDEASVRYKISPVKK